MRDVVNKDDISTVVKLVSELMVIIDRGAVMEDITYHLKDPKGN